MIAGNEVVIVSAARTPIGSFLGSLSGLSSAQLGSVVISEVLSRCSLKPSEVDEVLMGQVLTTLQGQNPPRQAAVLAEIPYSVPSAGISMACGSGLRAVVIASQAIKCGDGDIIVAGGMESMSQSAHALQIRSGVKMGGKELTDTMLKDGLTDAFHNYHMGVTAENIAKKYSITREAQDLFAEKSQQKVQNSIKAGSFNEEIVPVLIANGSKVVLKENLDGKNTPASESVELDEYPRADCSMKSLGKLRPAFLKDSTGTVTAGNSSGINDGAAAVLLMSARKASELNLKPMATIVSSAVVGVDPEIMGIGPVPAVQKAVAKAGWNLSDIDLFEINEAFAVQSLAVIAQLNLDVNKVNVNGGSVALGHPIGASGCRVLVTLLYAMKHRKVERGCVALCMGGGMGIAMCIQMK